MQEKLSKMNREIGEIRKTVEDIGPRVMRVENMLIELISKKKGGFTIKLLGCGGFTAAIIGALHKAGVFH